VRGLTVANLSEESDWAVVAYMRTTATELRRLQDVHPDAATLLQEGSDRLAATLDLLETQRKVIGGYERARREPTDSR